MFKIIFSLLCGILLTLVLFPILIFFFISKELNLKNYKKFLIVLFNIKTRRQYDKDNF